MRSLFLQFMHLCVNMTLQDPAGSRANLEGVNLKGAVLEGSIMAGINLRVATLKNVNMQNCDLRMAVLVSGLIGQHPGLTLLFPQAGADLENCNLSGSDLHEANLRGANLKVNCTPSQKRACVFHFQYIFNFLFTGCNP